jgi:acetylornithine aminotransferase
MFEFQEKWEKHLLNNYGTPSLKIVKGKGVWVKDSNGRSYLDFLSGIAVSSLGHSHPAIIKSVKKQIKNLSHTSNFYAHDSVLNLAQKLTSKTGRVAKVFFCNSGTEANEAAFKLTRLATNKPALSLNNSFHGRTMGALSLTGQMMKQKGYEPMVPGVVFAEPNDPADLKDKTSSDIGSIFFEPIQGEGGVVDLSTEYLKELSAVAKTKNAFLVADEVQTGIGRCGYWFLSEGLELEPDVIVLAKGLAGGLPIGAILVFGELIDIFKPGSHGSTFGGNPVSCAAALSVIETIEKQNLLDNARLRGEQLVRNLASHKSINGVSGAGLLRGVHLLEPRAKKVVEIAQANGLLVNSVSENIIRLAPPLIVNSYQIDRASEILVKAIEAA